MFVQLKSVVQPKTFRITAVLTARYWSFSRNGTNEF